MMKFILALFVTATVSVTACVSPVFARSPCSVETEALGGDGVTYLQCLRRSEGLAYKNREDTRREFEQGVARELERLRSASR